MTMTNHIPATDHSTPDRPEPRILSPHEVRLLMYRLTLDWVGLRLAEAAPSVSAPPSLTGARTSNVRTFGHPAEWASDTCALIATQFWWWHEDLSSRRGETPPRRLARPWFWDDRGHRVVPTVVPRTRRAPARTATEQAVVKAAWKYLEPRVEELIEVSHPETEPFAPAFELHGSIRARMGLTQQQRTLPIPCPNNDCNLRTLQRIAGMEHDFIICGACKYTIKAEHYPLLVRMALDTITDGETR